MLYKYIGNMGLGGVYCGYQGYLASTTKNPDFSNPQFLEPPDNSNQLSFPLDLLYSNTAILSLIS